MNRARRTSRTPRTPRTAESLMRWLAVWLALAVCAHALALGTAALRGVAHRHGSLQSDAAKPMLLWRHGANPTDLRDAHLRAHTAGESHQHAIDDASVLGSDAHAAALAALVTAPAPRAHAALSASAPGLHHVWAAVEPWAPTARTVAPPRHPPRA